MKKNKPVTARFLRGGGHKFTFRCKSAGQLRRLFLPVFLAAFLFSAAFLGGCGRSAGSALDPAADKGTADAAGQTTPAAENASQTDGAKSFGGKSLSAEDSALLTALQEASGEEVFLFDCADYDSDGVREAFAFTGTRQDGYLKGHLWFSGAEGAIQLEPHRQTTDGKTVGEQPEFFQDHSTVLQTADGLCYWYTESDGGSSTTSWLWGVKDGRPYETILSGKGMDLSKDGNDNFFLTQSAFDGGTDGTGHTYKPCYFYYADGDFHEYGSCPLTLEEFLGLKGAEDCTAPVQEENYWIRTIFLRGNGLVQVNMTDNSQNKTIVCAMENGSLVTVSENEGFSGTLIGEIVTSDWLGGQNELQTLWEQKNRDQTGLFAALQPNQTAWFDLDDDGQPEKILFRTDYDPESYRTEGVSFEIDDREVWSLQLGADGYNAWVTDLDASDGKKELVIKGQEANDSFFMLKFLSYENGTLKELGDLAEASVLNDTGHLFRITPWEEGYGDYIKIPGDGTLSIWADTPVYVNGLGCYYVKLSFRFGDNGFTQIPQDEYEMKVPWMYGKPFVYTAQAALPFFASPEDQPSGEPSFILDPGDQMYSIALAPCTKELIFVKMQRTDGSETGWMLFSETQLFTELPGWG